MQDDHTGYAGTRECPECGRSSLVQICSLDGIEQWKCPACGGFCSGRTDDQR